MTARRQALRIAVLGFVPLTLAGLGAGQADAHGSMTHPVSRVAACYAEGPENPRSAACEAAVAAGGTQALYDWNAVNVANAAGRHRQLIPDGKLCSANNDRYKGLDLARADWPATPFTPGNRTFRYKATAPHEGSFELYITKAGYDPAGPLTWSDLEDKPFLTVNDPKAENGEYVFDGIVPNRSGRHLIYSVWQRSDSPEAFYACSDVVFGKDSAGAGAGTGPAATPAPHGRTHTGAPPERRAAQAQTGTRSGAPVGQPGGGRENLAETGGDSATPYIAIGGAAALAVGAAALFASVRRESVPTGGRHGR